MNSTCIWEEKSNKSAILSIEAEDQNVFAGSVDSRTECTGDMSKCSFFFSLKWTGLLTLAVFQTALSKSLEETAGQLRKAVYQKGMCIN